MKTPALLLAATLFACSPAIAGTYAGAPDGGYRSPDGDFILIASAEKLVGVQGLDCKNVAVRNARLKAKNCWGNGHLGGDVDVSWLVEGDTIISNGKRYTREPPLKRPATSGALNQTIIQASASSAADKFDGDAWWHNGSRVLIDTKYGEIRYDEPKASIQKTIRRGEILFRGEFHANGRVDGVAYAFKAGCAPAAYNVTGTYPLRPNFIDGRIVLKGASPKRDPNGCDVFGYTTNSPNARLIFDIDGDV